MIRQRSGRFSGSQRSCCVSTQTETLVLVTIVMLNGLLVVISSFLLGVLLTRRLWPCSSRNSAKGTASKGSPTTGGASRTFYESSTVSDFKPIKTGKKATGSG